MSPRSAKGVAREVGRTARWLPMLARLSRDLPAFLRTPLSTARAVELARDRVARREPRFLRSAELLIYKHERSPYLALLRSAGLRTRRSSGARAQRGHRGGARRPRREGGVRHL